MEFTNNYRNKQQKTIEEIKKAEFSVWIVAEELTDRVMFELLLDKLKEGINVEIVFINGYVNGAFIDFREFTNAGGEIYVLNQQFRSNIIQNPFCILDNKAIVKNIPNFSDKKSRKLSFSPIVIKEQDIIVKRFVKGYLLIKNSYSWSRYRAA